jgi:TonB family protein
MYYLILIVTILFSCNNQKTIKQNVITDVDTASQINADNTNTYPDSTLRNPKNFIDTKSSTTKPVQRDFAYQPIVDKPEIFDTQPEETLASSDIYKRFEKTPQTFLIQADKDTLIICKEGTSIKIQPNSFMNAKTGKAITNPIQIYITEYYKLSDIILANLSTTSGNEILETGGMINISANSNNEECILKQDKELEIGFPYFSEKKDMSLFTGQMVNNQIDWKLSKMRNNQQSSSTQEMFTIVEEMPSFPGGDKERLKYISMNSKYPFTSLEKKIEGTIYVSFIVDEFGLISNVKILRGLDTELDKVAYDLVSRMPKWLPGKQNGNPVRVLFNMPVEFNLKGIELTEETIAEAKRKEEKIKDIKVNYSNDYFSTNDKNYKEEFENTMNDSSLRNVGMSEINRYLFSTSQLGWINCDKFLNDSRPKIDYIVKTNETEETIIKVIFHGTRSIIPGVFNKNQYIFRNVPIGEKITIVAFKNNIDKVHLAVKETIIKKNGESDLVFEPVTMTKLKSELEKIEKIN